MRCDFAEHIQVCGKRHFEFRVEFEHDGGLQILEIIVVTHKVAQVNDCVIRDNGSLKRGIQSDLSCFF